MKALPAILATTLLVTSTATIAQQRFGGDVTPESADNKNFCVYEDAKYSIGALIEVGDQVLECRMVPSTSELLESGARWVSLYSQE